MPRDDAIPYFSVGLKPTTSIKELAAHPHLAFHNREGKKEGKRGWM